MYEDELRDIKGALIIRDVINDTVQHNPQVRIYGSGKIIIQLFRLRPEGIRALAKELKMTFDKKVTHQGFLKYEGRKGPVTIYISTGECFYGGDPIVRRFPRTYAQCPVNKGEK